ncbi:MAG: hypothetical protein WDZ29_05025 [Balneolaceae bacterium]
MNKYVLIYLFTTIYFVTGCSEPKIQSYDDSVHVIDVDIEDWSTIGELPAVYLPHVSREVSDPRFISVSGDYLVISDHTDSGMLKVFSITHQYQHIGSYGIAGPGPQEFGLLPFLTRDEPKGEPLLSMIDFSNKVYYKVDIEDIIEDERFVPIRSIHLPVELVHSQRVITMNEGELVGLGGGNDGKLVKYDMAADSISEHTEFVPAIAHDILNKGYLYTGEMTVNNESGLIAVVSLYFRQLEIYDKNLNLIIVSRLDDTPELEIESRDGRYRLLDEARFNYGAIDSYGDKIFVLYINRTIGEIENGSCIENPSEIHIYNWEGRFLSRVKLTDCPTTMAYDHIHNRIIGVFGDTENEEQIIGTYDLIP